MITPKEESAGETGFTISGDAPKAMAMVPIEASVSDKSSEDGAGTGTVQGLTL